MKIVHIIVGLATGGAERMLYELLSQMDRHRFESRVISLTQIVPVGEMIERLGVPVKALGMRASFPDPVDFLRLVHWIRIEKPDIIQTWMYHADLMGAMASKLVGGIPVVWGIHNASPRLAKFTTRRVAKLCAYCSNSLPEIIVASSEDAKRTHGEYGYVLDRITVIPNGIDLSMFYPNNANRELYRSILCIGKDDLIIGHVGRWDEIKDYKTFIRAAGILHSRLRNVHFVLVGANIDNRNNKLLAWINEEGIENVSHLLGERKDVPALMNTFDLMTSTSIGESFGLSIAEAMASGVPCVVSDIGGFAGVVGDMGKVVPPKDPQALADAWSELIEIGSEDRRRLGLAARRRIEENFGLSSTVAQYESLYVGLLTQCAE